MLEVLNTKTALGRHCPTPDCLKLRLLQPQLTFPITPLMSQAEKVSYKVYVCDWHVIFIRGLAGWFGGLAGCLHLYCSCGCYNGTG